MAQVIILAKRYQKRPSEILDIEDAYVAYCFDEIALYLETEATSVEGRIEFGKIKWNSVKKRSNQELIEFIKKH